MKTLWTKDGPILGGGGDATHWLQPSLILLARLSDIVLLRYSCRVSTPDASGGAGIGQLYDCEGTM
ncbi:MAG: hypothetical protein NTZ74_01170 [Chloroflexi bacterium]|nr:hypothetical protein [Chloroflexota bacterium]